MKYFLLHRNVLKACALVATVLSLPALGYAGDKGQGNNNDDHGEKKVHSVPEGGPGMLLSITTIGAVLLFSARRPSQSNT